MKPMLSSQQGATLLVSLIILVLMTLLAVTTFNISKTGLQVVGNMQQRNQAMAAAQEAINDVISSTKFIDTPTAALSNGTNAMTVDINGDGGADINVNIIAPTCIKSQILKSAQLNPTLADDAGCLLGTGQNYGVEGATTGDSLCAEGLWEIVAEATDNVSQVAYTVTQGVGVRVSIDKIDASCPP